MMKTNCPCFNPEYTEDEPSLEQLNVLTGYTILEFGAPWCGHCQVAQPAIQSVFLYHNPSPHIKIYDGKGKPLGRAFKVKLWPTLILLCDGKEVTRLVRPTQLHEVKNFLSAMESENLVF